jgi:hypothetical protein
VLELGSMVVDVRDNRLDAVFLRENGLIRDRFTLLKPDPRPKAPVGLFAVAASGSQIDLHWTIGTGAYDNFVVERSTDGINFTEVMTVAGGTMAVEDTGLAANTTYFYRVRGVNGYGQGEYSAVASASTVVPASEPRAPGGLVVKADNGVEYYRSRLVLRWLDRSTNESSFQIERSLDGTTFVPVATVAANLTTFVDRNLESATYHYYRVRAVNALGTSAPSVIAGDETHPQSQMALSGESVTLQAGVERVGAARYQWRYYGAPLEGETNQTLTLSGLQPGDEGDYTVVVWDDTGREESNPAYVLVVSAPQILAQPLDREALVGASLALHVSAVGTDPTTYQWYHNGTLIPGATGPTLALTDVQFDDAGGYAAMIANDFGVVTTRAATLTVYHRPTFAPIQEQLAEVLTPVVLTVAVSDANTPKLPLTFSLGAGAPTNASIHPTSGLFQWTPTREQAPGTYAFTVIAQDTARPDLSVSTAVPVTVRDYLEVSTTTLVINAGETNAIPIDVFSSAALQGLRLRLELRQDQFKDMLLEQTLPDVVTTVVDASNPNAVVLTFSALAGQSIQGTQQLARLRFRTLADQPSAIALVHMAEARPTRAEEGLEPTKLLNDGRVVILGVRPLLEARLTGGQRQLAIYGRLGSNYTLQSRFGFGTGTVWANRSTLTMTNTFRVLPAPSATAPIIMFQLRQ